MTFVAVVTGWDWEEGFWGANNVIFLFWVLVTQVNSVVKKFIELYTYDRCTFKNTYSNLNISNKKNSSLRDFNVQLMLRAIEIDLEAAITVKKIVSRSSMYTLTTVVLEQHEGLGHCSHSIKYLSITPWLSKNLTTIVPGYLWGIGSRKPPPHADIKIQGCSSPSYKMA